MVVWIQPIHGIRDEISGVAADALQYMAEWQLTVANKSDSAIYEWSLGVWHVDRSHGFVMTCIESRSHEVGALAPSDVKHKTFCHPEPPPTTMSQLRVCILWRDNLGRSWLNYNGSLVGPASEEFPRPWTAFATEDVDVDAHSERVLGQPIPGWPASSATSSNHPELT